ncbi:hypothetical protein ABZ707_30270 [Streptomyces sp. NPDC006923]|uniref:hypothetical protein n=1 Tax=Streptomyces sp. NPDC006923 TaxID=3155355 RepID=UPI0033F5DEB8
MPHPHAQIIAGRIEDLYGAPLADLAARADALPVSGMLAALLGSYNDLALSERSIAFHLQRLRQLSHPERETTPFDAGHILDCARRIAEAVAVRDAHTKTMSAVLQSLQRVPAPDTGSPASVPAPAPVPPAAPTHHPATTAPTR